MADQHKCSRVFDVDDDVYKKGPLVSSMKLYELKV